MPSIATLRRRRGGGPTPVIIPPDFIAAIGAALAADVGLCSAIGETGVGSGLKIFQKLAPRGITPTWIVYMVITEVQSRFGPDSYFTNGLLQITTFGTTSQAAKPIAEMTRTVLEAAFDAGTIIFTDGRLMDLWFANQTSIVDPDPAPIKGRIWQEIRVFGFRYQGPQPG